jgi:hypothetical protein
MFTINVSTSYRQRQRRHARLPVAVTRDRRSIHLVAMPTPDLVRTIAAPDAPWPGLDDRYADLDQATWEDAEWR